LRCAPPRSPPRGPAPPLHDGRNEDYIDDGGEVEEDNGEFVVVIPGDGDGADKYVDCDDKVEDGGDDCKPAAPPPLGGGSRIGRKDGDNSNNDSDDSDGGSGPGGRGG
jgi:hypothetical protein